MDIYTKLALVIRLRLETANLNYSRAKADVDRLCGSDLRDPAVYFLLCDGEDFIRCYESVWGARSASEASA